MLKVLNYNNITQQCVNVSMFYVYVRDLQFTQAFRGLRFNNTLVYLRVPCAEVNLAIAMYFYSHVFSRHSVIFCSFYIPKKCVWCPYHLGRVPCHVKRRAEIMRQPWIIPPLTEENIHRVFLTRKNPRLHLIEKKSVSFALLTFPSPCQPL